MSREEILVVGYPKSGNTWLSWMIGDALDSPITGYRNAIPIATEGESRSGKYLIRQLHLTPTENEFNELLPNPYTLSVPRWDGERIVFISRDPRDVVVSAMYYWRIKSLDMALEAVATGDKPTNMCGPYVDFVRSWMNVSIPIRQVRYEDLLVDKAYALYRVLADIRTVKKFDQRIKGAYQRQSFASKREQLERDGHTRPYGRAIQLHNLRKGVSGDWRNHFSREQAKRAHDHFGDLMFEQGYIHNEVWWKDI